MKTKHAKALRVERTMGMLAASAGLVLVLVDPALLLLMVAAVPLAAAAMMPLFM